MSEWKIDEKGNKYREVAPGCIEYAPVILMSGGAVVHQDQVEEYHRRQREADEKRRTAALEEFKNRPITKDCPFSSGMIAQCKKEKCAIFHDGVCSIAGIADEIGSRLNEEPHGKCPFSVNAKCAGCTLFNNGCALVRIASALKNREEKE